MNDYYKQLLDMIGDSVVGINLTGKIQSMNKAGFVTFGYSSQEILGRNFSVIMAGPKEGGHNFDKSSLGGGSGYFLGKGPVEVIGKTKAGKLINMEMVASEIIETRGKLIVCALRDITKRKRLQKEKTEFELLYKLLADNSHDVISIHDKKGKRLYLSPSIEKHLGYEPSLIINKSPLFMIHEEDAPTERRMWEQVVFLDKKTFSWRMRRQHADGHYVWFENYTEPIFTKNGTVETCITTSRNITDHIFFEETDLPINQIIEDSGSEIYISSGDSLKILYANKKARKTLGYSLKEFRKKTIIDLKPKELRERLKLEADRITSGHVGVIKVKTMHEKKDGSIVEVEILDQLSFFGGKTYLLSLVETQQ